MKDLKILVAEDSEGDFTLLSREISSGGLNASITRVSNLDEFEPMIEACQWDLVISDYFMPGASGLDLLKVVKEKKPDIPVIIMSGLMREDFAVTAMKSGASDFISKGNLSRLVPAIERELRESKLRSAHSKAEEEIILLNKLLKTIYEINQMIVRETDKERLLYEACRILVEQGGFLMSIIGMADYGTREVIPMAYAGFGDDYVRNIRLRFDESVFGNGPTGKAMRSGKHSICLDVDADKDFSPWLDDARKMGFKACASFPFQVRGKVAGALNVYTSNPDLLEEKMVELLKSMTNDIGYAVQAIEEAREHRLAVKALKESEERLRTIFESAMDGMFVIDTGGGFVDVNFAGCHMFGYSRDEILSAGVGLIAHGADVAARKKIDWNREAFIPEIPMKKKNSSAIWVDMTITPFSVGEKDLALAVMRDITDRKLAEEALRESEERFHQLFIQSEDPQLIFKNGSYEILDSNPAALRLYGYSKEDLLRFGCSLFLELPDRLMCEEMLRGINHDKGFSIDRVDSIRKDGSKIKVSIKGQLIRLKNSEMVYCTIRDITDLIRMEEEARYIQAKLIHANKMTSIGTLASGVAHEINNPNNFILFNSNLLSEAWKDAFGILERYYREHGDFSMGGLPFSEMREVIPELLSGIADGSRRIKGIVDTLKDFSRMDKSKLEGEFDINRAVMASTSILNTQINKYTENFRIFCGENIPLVRGSSQKIEQVLINLIINALHALPDRKKGVAVETCFDGKDIIVKVADEGAGMSKEVLDRVTEPFFTTKTEAGGTGLGLSISYTIIKEHKGSLEFDSAPGRGTTVTLRLSPGKLRREIGESLN